MKHFIDISDFNRKQLDAIIKKAKQLKKNPNKFLKRCYKKTLGMIFQKESTRTRVSFNVGFNKMGGNCIELNASSIGFGKRESHEDILRALSQYIDVLMIRNDDHNILKNLSALNLIPIINGLSDYSHPCQILSDLLTITEKLGEIQNHTELLDKLKNNGTIITCHANLMSLLLLKSPGELGVDISFGTAQSFGIPLWFGGPHPAFFSTKIKYIRQIPGKIVGKSIDAINNKCYRITYRYTL